jgi:DNA-binding transcriptional MerR regulator/GGDEF domain-containing protein
MNDRNIHNIKSYLQTEEVQKRISENMLHRRSEVTVTIGRAAELFGFTENQLRDWEDRGLLTPQRSTKQRQYTLADLDKLTIIRELIDAKYAPGDIPLDIDSIWYEIYSPIEQVSPLITDVNRSDHLHIDQRIDRAEKEQFWRYYASQALRLSLMLICEDVPDTSAGAGLVLPLRKMNTFNKVYRTEDLSKLGISLVGWLGKNRSIHVFLDFEPSFEVASDFRVQPLQIMEKDVSEEKSPEDSTLIVVQRKAKPLNLSSAVVETIRRLLAPLYEDIESWKACFDQGMRDALYAAPKFTTETTQHDDVLDGLADIVVRLGGKTPDGQDRWRFCCILLPNNPLLPLQQRSLVVRAQSKNSPHEVGKTVISPDKYVDSPSLRAFQSGHIVYRPEAAKDTAIAHRELEEPVHSAIALSVGGEGGEPIAVLYVTSGQEHGFHLADRRILRMMGRIVEEVLLTYCARQRVMDKLSDLIIKPDVIDTLFENFSSENDFNTDVEELLKEMKKLMAENKVQLTKKDLVGTDLPSQQQIGKPEMGASVLSLIAVDVDNQSILSSRYGDRVTRSLSYEVAGRIQEELRGHDQKLYHIYADRFYITLNGKTLEQAREKAQELKQALNSPYRFDALRTSSEQQARTASMLALPDITVRLGVASFSYAKLEDLLQRYASGDTVTEVMEIITRALNQALEKGKDEGGNVVITWDLQFRGTEPIWTLKKVE